MRENRGDAALHVSCTSCQKRFTLPVNQEDYEAWVGNESHVQALFPYLSDDDRGLLVSRTCGACYDAFADLLLEE